MLNAGLLLFCVTLFMVAVPYFATIASTALHRLPIVSGRCPPRKVDLQASAAEGMQQTTLWVRVLVTLTVLVCALYIILSKQYEPDQQKWAFGVIGTVLGYWLKG